MKDCCVYSNSGIYAIYKVGITYNNLILLMRSLTVAK